MEVSTSNYDPENHTFSVNYKAKMGETHSEALLYVLVNELLKCRIARYTRRKYKHGKNTRLYNKRHKRQKYKN